MFIAMNRFRVRHGQEERFEELWRDRDVHLTSVPGFVRFHLLRGPSDETATLFSSHTLWESRAAFEDWTRSQAFRDAHKNAGDHAGMHEGHPRFEGFDIVQTVS